MRSTNVTEGAGPPGPAFFVPAHGGATRLTLCNASRGETIATALALAVDRTRRRRGLLGRDRLDPQRGLLLAPCRAIHTCFMRFPIDVLFVSRDGRVVALHPAIGPWRFAIGSREAWCAIELAAGAIERSGTCVGDRLAMAICDASRPGRTGLT